MSDPVQAQAYADADFSEPHSRFVDLLAQRIGSVAEDGCALDLGCGPADVTIRFARRFPRVRVHAIDASEPMLELGRRAVASARLGERISLLTGRLPEVALPKERYEGIFSNSLLHHLAHPSALWDVVRRAGAERAWVFVMDLMRPDDEAQARGLVERHVAGAPEVLRRDFYRSLCAAYRPAEVREQLRTASLDSLEVEIVSDRHLVIWGRL